MPDFRKNYLINSNFRVRPSSKFAHTVDRVKEYRIPHFLKTLCGYMSVSTLRREANFMDWFLGVVTIVIIDGACSIVVD